MGGRRWRWRRRQACDIILFAMSGGGGGHRLASSALAGAVFADVARDRQSLEYKTRIWDQKLLVFWLGPFAKVFVSYIKIHDFFPFWVWAKLSNINDEHTHIGIRNIHRKKSVLCKKWDSKCPISYLARPCLAGHWIEAWVWTGGRSRHSDSWLLLKTW